MSRVSPDPRLKDHYAAMYCFLDMLLEDDWDERIPEDIEFWLGKLEKTTHFAPVYFAKNVPVGTNHCDYKTYHERLKTALTRLHKKENGSCKDNSKWAVPGNIWGIIEDTFSKIRDADTLYIW